MAVASLERPDSEKGQGDAQGSGLQLSERDQLVTSHARLSCYRCSPLGNDVALSVPPRSPRHRGGLEEGDPVLLHVLLEGHRVVPSALSYNDAQDDREPMEGGTVSDRGGQPLLPVPPSGPSTYRGPSPRDQATGGAEEPDRPSLLTLSTRSRAGGREPVLRGGHRARAA